MKNHATNLQSAFDWLRHIVTKCLRTHLGKTKNFAIDPLGVYSEDSILARFIAAYKPTQEEFMILLLAPTPHIKPAFFVNIIAKNLPEGGDIPEFGGVKVADHRGIFPTGETAPVHSCGP